MVSKCEHCGQTIMATDGQCWHCGKGVSGRKAKSVQQPHPATAVPEEAFTLPSLNIILLYAGLTAVALIILVITTRAIGQAPLFTFGSVSPLETGWKAVTNSQQQFTLNLPENWHIFELARASEAPALKSSSPLQALNPQLNSLAADHALIFLGTEDAAVFADGSPVFVLIVYSQQLGQLTVQEAVNVAQQQLPENASLVEFETVEKDAREPRGFLLFNIAQDEQIWRCQEQFVMDDGGMYVVAACTSFAQFPAHLSDFELILDSFQPLRS